MSTTRSGESLVAAAEDQEPGKREDDGAEDADDEEGVAGCRRCSGGVGGFVGRVGVVVDGEECALRHRFG